MADYPLRAYPFILMSVAANIVLDVLLESAVWSVKYLDTANES
jgi:hypothetical protein